MRYGVPEITDLGQIGEHVFVNFSPNNEEPPAGAVPGGGLAGGTVVATGSEGGLAGLGLIGGLFAALSGRRSSTQQVGSGEAAGGEPEADRANEK